MLWVGFWKQSPSCPTSLTAGSTGTDARAIDEISHYISVADKGDGVPEHMIVNFARTRVPIHAILRVIEIMLASGQIEAKGQDRIWTPMVPCEAPLMLWRKKEHHNIMQVVGDGHKPSAHQPYKILHHPGCAH